MKLSDKIVDLILVVASHLCNKITAKKYNALSQEKLNDKFLFACQYQSLQEVESFFTNKYFKSIAHINTCNGLALRKAAMGGQVDIFHFLLTSNKIVKPIEMGEHIFLCFKIARKYNQPAISKYLKESQLFKHYLIQRAIEKEKNKLELTLEEKPIRKNNFKI